MLIGGNCNWWITYVGWLVLWRHLISWQTNLLQVSNQKNENTTIIFAITAKTIKFRNNDCTDNYNGNLIIMHCEFPITVSVKSSQKTSYSLHLHLLTEEQKSCEVSALLRRCQTSFSSKKKWKCICPICPIYNNTYFKVVHCSISPNLQQ